AAEEGGSPLDALGINMGFLLAQFVNFGIIFVALATFLWRPLVNMMDARSAKIEKGREDAAAAANARLNAEQEADKIRAEARAEAQRVVEEARGRGEEVAKGIEAEARTESDKIRQQAHEAAVEERDQQLAGLRSQVASISIAVAQRLIGEALDEKRQQALINDFFSKVPAEAKSMKGEVEVISAMPLSDSEKTRIQKEIGASTVDFVVDPSILGGVIVRSDDRVVDGSIRSGLNEMSARLG
ncbi:MAG: F0F1 ATP synthase subunit B, partial [Anaerolineae bacterium]|nr:F0F1 ATP synthase subunit B [Anaerolineae bacterium]